MFGFVECSQFQYVYVFLDPPSSSTMTTTETALQPTPQLAPVLQPTPQPAPANNNFFISDKSVYSKISIFEHFATLLGQQQVVSPGGSLGDE